MSGREKTIVSMSKSLQNQCAFGTSRHAAKQELRNQKGYEFAKPVDTIHSYKTLENYKKTINQFDRWRNNKGFGKYTALDSKTLTRQAEEYLKERLKTCSVATVKSDRSALNRVLGNKVEVNLPKYSPKEATKGRNHDPLYHFNLNKQKDRDVLLLAKATGGRRSDLEKLKPENFFKKDDTLFVNFLKSKGGRDRVTPVLPQYQKAVEELLTRYEKDQTFFDLHKDYNIHAFRREYAEELLEYIKDHPEDEERLSAYYKPYRKTTESEYYTTRGEKINRTERRDLLYVVSQALGHNRLEVVMNSYLTLK